MASHAQWNLLILVLVFLAGFNVINQIQADIVEDVVEKVEDLAEVIDKKDVDELLAALHDGEEGKRPPSPPPVASRTHADAQTQTSTTPQPANAVKKGRANTPTPLINGKESDGARLQEAAKEMVENLRHDQDVPLEAIVQRLDKLEKRQSNRNEKALLSVDSLEDDNKSLLEIVSESVYDWITTQMTPSTDRECRWSYSQAKCVPKCKCFYQFQLGDYTLSRSCRLITNQTEIAACNPEAYDETDDNMLIKAKRTIVHGIKIVDHVLDKARRTFVHGIKIVDHVLDKYAPPTDKFCDWSWRKLRCEPRAQCRFLYKLPMDSGIGAGGSYDVNHVPFKLGDYHIGRSCRLREGVSGITSLPRPTEEKERGDSEKRGGDRADGSSVRFEAWQDEEERAEQLRR